MGASQFEMRCSGCDYHHTHDERGGYYLLDVDAWITRTVFLDTAYCARERRLVAAEVLPSVEELELALQALERDGKDEVDEVTGLPRPLEPRLNAARKAVAWRRERTLGARCLECGSTDVSRIEVFDEAAHPGCPGAGRFRMETWSICEFADIRFFSPDGERISDEVAESLWKRRDG